MTRERAAILVALLAILGAILWTARPQETTAAERVDRLTSELRCVTCQGLSVKDSPAESARQMHALVMKRVAEGRTDDQIRDEFRASYGDWVFLSPSIVVERLICWCDRGARCRRAVALCRCVGPKEPSAPSPHELAA